MTVPSERRLGVRAALAIVALVLVAVPFTVVAVLAARTSSPLAHLDNTIENSVHVYALDHSGFTGAMRVVSTVGAPIVWWFVLGPIFVWQFAVRQYRRAAFVAVTALGSALLNLLLKSAIDRDRPELLEPLSRARGSSFPSSHTQAAVVGFGIVVVICWPLVAARGRVLLCAGATLGVALIGFSRIALGVHYLSDIVGAILIGAAWVLAMTAAFVAWRTS